MFSPRHVSAQEESGGDASGRTAEQLSDVALNMFVVGSMYEYKEDYPKAYTAYAEALKYDDDAVIHSAAARMALQMKRTTDAIGHLRRAVQLQPGDLKLRRTLSEVFLSTGRHDSAAAVLMEVIRRDSADRNTRMLLGRLYEEHDTVSAMEQYRHILQHGAESDASYRLANLYNLRGRVDSATAVLEELRSAAGADEHLLQTTANLYMRQFAFDKAAALYDTLSSAYPGKPAYMLLHAEALMNLGDWSAASDLLFPLAGDQNVGQEDRIQIGKIYFQKALQEKRDVARAIAVFDTLHNDFPGDWRPQWFRGAVLFNEGDTDGAITSFEDVLRIAPDNREAASILVRALVSRERYAKAIDILESLHTRGQADTKLMIMLGEVQLLNGDRGAALEAWEEALRADPGNTELQNRIEQLDE